MKRKKQITAVALTCLLHIFSGSVYAEETEMPGKIGQTETEEEKREEARQYIDKNGVWMTSENMKLSVTLPDDTWKQSEEGRAGYECNLVSGENVMEIQVLAGEEMPSNDIPESLEQMQSMVKGGAEVIEFEAETAQERTTIQTVLKLSESNAEVYRYAVSFQLYQGTEYLEAVAYTDEEALIYILLESVSSAELL